nr:hypothetical protein [Geodermatophilaceae bacterium]
MWAATGPGGSHRTAGIAGLLAGLLAVTLLLATLVISAPGAVAAPQRPPRGTQTSAPT